MTDIEFNILKEEQIAEYKQEIIDREIAIENHYKAIRGLERDIERESLRVNDDEE